MVLFFSKSFSSTSKQYVEDSTHQIDASYLGFKGNILYFEKVKNNIKKGRRTSGGVIGILIVILLQVAVFNIFYK